MLKNILLILTFVAMKEQVSSNPRTPTSNWSGYGFSKSLPGYIIRQKMQESRQMKAAHVRLTGCTEREVF